MKNDAGWKLEMEGRKAFWAAAAAGRGNCVRCGFGVEDGETLVRVKGENVCESCLSERW